MPPDNDKGRPAANHEAARSCDGDVNRIREFERRADHEWRIAALRVYGFECTNSAWLSAQLFDFAHLLEACENTGWFQ